MSNHFVISGPGSFQYIHFIVEGDRTKLIGFVSGNTAYNHYVDTTTARDHWAELAERGWKRIRTEDCPYTVEEMIKLVSN